MILKASKPLNVGGDRNTSQIIVLRLPISWSSRSAMERVGDVDKNLNRSKEQHKIEIQSNPQSRIKYVFSWVLCLYTNCCGFKVSNNFVTFYIPYKISGSLNRSLICSEELIDALVGNKVSLNGLSSMLNARVCSSVFKLNAEILALRTLHFSALKVCQGFIKSADWCFKILQIYLLQLDKIVNCIIFGKHSDWWLDRVVKRIFITKSKHMK